METKTVTSCLMHGVDGASVSHNQSSKSLVFITKDDRQRKAEKSDRNCNFVVAAVNVLSNSILARYVLVVKRHNGTLRR